MKKRRNVASGARNRRTSGTASGKSKSRRISKKSGAEKKERSGIRRAGRSGAKKAPLSRDSRRSAGSSLKRKTSPPKKALPSKRPRTSSSRAGSMFMEPLEEVTVTCSNCNRKFSIVKILNLKTEGMICQRCSVGEIQFPD